MKEEIINLPTDKDILLFKLVSGEEIICHVSANTALNNTEAFILIHDPYMIIPYEDRLAFSHWIKTGSRNYYPLYKKDIMVIDKPIEEFLKLYNSIIHQKYCKDSVPTNHYGTETLQ